MRFPTQSEFDPDFTLDDETTDPDTLADEMDLSATDVFSGPDGENPRRVESVRGNTVRVSNPVVAHPQDAEAGTQPCPLTQLYVEWRRGRVVPATVIVEPDTPEEGEAAQAAQ